MSTFLFEISTLTTVMVQKDGFSTYKPRSMSPTVNGNIISFHTEIDINYDFVIDTATDDVYFQGGQIAGTAQEISDALVASIFSAESAGGGSVEGLTSDGQSLLFGDWLGAAPYLFDVGSSTTSAGVYADNTNGSVNANGQNASGSLLAYINDTGDADDDEKVVLRAQNSLAMEYRTTNTAPHVFKINGTTVLIVPSAFGDYADDAAAAAGGVPVKGLYHTSGALQIRLV